MAILFGTREYGLCGKSLGSIISDKAANATYIAHTGSQLYTSATGRVCLMVNGNDL